MLDRGRHGVGPFFVSDVYLIASPGDGSCPLQVDVKQAFCLEKEYAKSRFELIGSVGLGMVQKRVA